MPAFCKRWIIITYQIEICKIKKGDLRSKKLIILDLVKIFGLMSFRIQFNCYCALLGHDTQIPNNRKVASCSRYKDVVADKITGNRKTTSRRGGFLF